MPELPSEKDGAEKRRKRSTVRRNSVLFTGVFKAHIELHVRKKTSRSRRKIDKPVQICYKSRRFAAGKFKKQMQQTK